MANNEVIFFIRFKHFTMFYIYICPCIFLSFSLLCFLLSWLKSRYVADRVNSHHRIWSLFFFPPFFSIITHAAFSSEEKSLHKIKKISNKNQMWAKRNQKQFHFLFCFIHWLANFFDRLISRCAQEWNSNLKFKSKCPFFFLFSFISLCGYNQEGNIFIIHSVRHLKGAKGWKATDAQKEEKSAPAQTQKGRGAYRYTARISRQTGAVSGRLIFFFISPPRHSWKKLSIPLSFLFIWGRWPFNFFYR